MKKNLIIFGIISLLFLFKVDNYQELNSLKIIYKLDVECSDIYKVTLYEIIPKKSNNMINYDYKKYVEKGNDLLYIKKLLKKKYNNSIYYNNIKKVKTNCKNKKDIINTFFLSNKVKFYN